MIALLASQWRKAFGELIAVKPSQPHALYDDDRKVHEQRPRLLVSLDEHVEARGARQVGVVILTALNGEMALRRIGDPSDDNSDIDDFYRYHGALHLAHMAVLG